VNEESICRFFVALANNDPETQNNLTSLVTEYSLNEPNKWSFKLQQLHQFFLDLYPYSSLSYSQFRRLLFNSPVNHRLKEINFQIVIINSAAHIDDNLYGLQHCPSKT
jgi:hypothetical protein